MVRRPSPVDYPQHLCLDRGYDNPTGETAVRDHEYIGHTRQRPGQPPDAPDTKRYPARRWVVERTIAWLSKFRGVLVRYEVYDENYLSRTFASGSRWQTFLVMSGHGKNRNQLGRLRGIPAVDVRQLHV